eukprot:10831474-Alexandrium_andersonii.AAC.1
MQQRRALCALRRLRRSANRPRAPAELPQGGGAKADQGDRQETQPHAQRTALHDGTQPMHGSPDAKTQRVIRS